MSYEFQCPTCGQGTDVEYMQPIDLRIREPILPPEKKESKTKILNLPVRIAQIKLRDDNGPTDNLSSPERFLQIGDKFYDLKHIQSVPAFHVGQLEFCDE